MGRELTTDTLVAVEAQGLGGLVVLVRQAGLDVGLERQDFGPPQLVLGLPGFPRGLRCARLDGEPAELGADSCA